MSNLYEAGMLCISMCKLHCLAHNPKTKSVFWHVPKCRAVTIESNSCKESRRQYSVKKWFVLHVQSLSPHFLKSEIFDAVTKTRPMTSNHNVIRTLSGGIVPKAAMFLSRTQYTSWSNTETRNTPLNYTIFIFITELKKYHGPCP